MKKIFLLIIITNFAMYAKAQIVNIPDTNFKSILLNDVAINTNGDTEIQLSEAQSYNSGINCNASNISDLTGIESFTSLINLQCSGNVLTSLDLTQNLALEQLYCYDNLIASIDLSQNLNLEILMIFDNQLTSLDINQNVFLQNLHCQDNLIAQLDLSQNLSLRTITCGSNLFDSLDVTALDTSLIYLSCEDNFLDSLDLSQNTNLENLICDQNQLTTLDISHNKALKVLKCSYNDLTTINTDSNVVLTELTCRYNMISNADVTKNLNLNYLNFYQNDLSNIDVSQNINLIQLNLAYNNLTSLNVNNNVALTYLSCGENDLTTINTSQLIDLQQLYISGTLAEEINVGSNTDLFRLYTKDSPNLLVVNAANGNNINFTGHNFTNCPNLSCFQVDDVAYANANFTNKDATTSYSLDCGFCFDSYKTLDTAICEGGSYTSPNSAVYSATGIYYDTLINACGKDSIFTINLIVNENDSTQLVSEDFCTGDTLDFYGTSIITTGIYYHTSNNSNGCDSIILKVFTEISGVSISNNQGTLEATANMDSYQWYQDGDSIANETNASFTPTVDGDYTCEAELNACSFLSNTISYVIDTTGTAIQDLTFVNLRVFPNPTKGILHIDTDDMKVLGIKLYSLTGKLMQVFDAKSKDLDITSLNNGYFLLRIETTEGVAGFKIIKN